MPNRRSAFRLARVQLALVADYHSDRLFYPPLWPNRPVPEHSIPDELPIPQSKVLVR